MEATGRVLGTCADGLPMCEGEALLFIMAVSHIS